VPTTGEYVAAAAAAAAAAARAPQLLLYGGFKLELWLGPQI